MPRLVSVIIPTYNQAKVVTRAIDSALAQTYPHCEVIVVDDGSTDDTDAVLSGYADRILRIHQENRERAAARNHGLRHAHGEYVVWLDADDFLLPHMLCTQVDYLDRHPRTAFVHAYALKGDLSGKIVEPHVLMGAPLDVAETPFASLLMGTPILIHTTMVRRSCLETVGYFDETLASGIEDWDLWLRLSAQYEVGFTHQPLAVYTVDAGDHPIKLNRYQVQQNTPAMIERAFTYLPSGSPLLALKPRALARAHIQWGACVEHALGHRREAVAHLEEALAAYPGLAADVEVVPKGVAQFAMWSQDDGEAFIRSFFRGLPASASVVKHLEGTAMTLYHSKMSHLTAHQHRYGVAAGHALAALWANPAAVVGVARQFVRRMRHGG